MSTQGELHDVIIIGGGPAGSAAACAARRQRLNVVVIEAAAQPRPGLCGGWIGPSAGKLCAELGVPPESVARPFAGLRMWTWDWRQCQALRDEALRGWIVPDAALSVALLAVAEKRGATVRRNCTVAGLQLGETAARVTLAGGETLTGRLVLVADGAASPTAELARLAVTRQVTGGAHAAVAVGPTGAPEIELDVVLGATRTLQVATIARHPDATRVLLLTHDESVPARTQLSLLLDAGRRAGALPADFKARAEELPCWAGAALEMETHTGKHSLLIGAAGGFVSAFSSEGLYPALRSGVLAAETALRALQAAVPQDELATFGAAWRTDLADYLRMPNTDLGLLLPMVFNNEQMSRRVARAFLLGQSF